MHIRTLAFYAQKCAHNPHRDMHADGFSHQKSVYMYIHSTGLKFIHIAHIMYMEHLSHELVQHKCTYKHPQQIDELTLEDSWMANH